MESDAMRAVAYLTTDEEGSPAMLFFEKVEAATYCDEGEEPQALILQPDALKAIEEARVEARSKALEEAENAIPRNWLDSILSGPKAAFDLRKVDGRPIESVLRAVARRIRSLKESP